MQQRAMQMKMHCQIVQENYGFWSAGFDNSLSDFLEGRDFFSKGFHLADIVCQGTAWCTFTSPGIVLSEHFSFHTDRQVGSVLSMHTIKSKVVSKVWLLCCWFVLWPLPSCTGWRGWNWKGSVEQSRGAGSVLQGPLLWCTPECEYWAGVGRRVFSGWWTFRRLPA